MTFHFDLAHLANADELYIEVHGATFELKRHTEETLDRAGERHPVIAAMPIPGRTRFTHFADIGSEHFPPDALRWVRVLRPARPGVHLPACAAVAMIIPEGHLAAYYRRSFALGEKPVREIRSFVRVNANGRPSLHSGKLASLGVRGLPSDRDAALDMLVQAQTLVTTLDTASAFLAHHPSLSSMQPYTAAIVLNGHILPDQQIDPGQYNAMQLLASAIGNAGDDWSPVVECKDRNGNALQAQYALDGFTPGQQLYTYGVDPTVLQTSLAPSQGARRTAQDDSSLQNQIWTPIRGVTSLDQSGQSSAAKGTVGSGPDGSTPTYKWTVQEQTNHHGISVDPGSIAIDGSNNFSIDCSNSYVRTLYTGYQLYDDTGAPIGDVGLIGSVSATNTLMGAPMPTDPTNLAFNLGSASSATILFGSLGVTNWDGDVSPRGALLTGLWEYGVPVVFLVAGKALTSTSWFNKIVNDKELTVAALAILFPVVGGGVATAAALLNTKSVLITFADSVLGIVLQKGLEKLGEWLVEQAGEGAIASAFGPVGWVFKLVSSGLDFEEMAVTTGEVLSSPACISVSVKRAIDVSMTLDPDPRHGEAGHPDTAVWPSVAQTYTVLLDYEDGTNFQLSGTFPSTTTGTPLELFFSDVPAGGRFRILAGLYSSNGWLCGKYQSDWITAQPNDGSTLTLPAASITELLVPLAGDTQYVFKERIGHGADGFAWDATGAPPTATLDALSCGNGGTLCSLVDITLNNSAFQIGYAWRSSGQDLPPDSPSNPPSDAQLYSMQNLSVLAEPGSALISADIGLTDMPGIGYAPSYNAASEIDQNNFVVDPRGGGMNLRQVLLGGSETTFGLGSTDLRSWGSFPLQNVDAVLVHPNKAVVACSWQESKLMLLDLPPAGTADGDAPVALMVSGVGLRQGLMQGPKAMAATPDGRLLVLESINLRVQAFDVKGNAVPSFTPGNVLFDMTTTDVASTLDRGQLPAEFLSGLLGTQTTLLFTLDASFAAELDGGSFSASGDPLILALSQNGVLLSYDPAHMDDPSVSARIDVVEAGRSWIIADPRGMRWQILSEDQTLAVYWLPSATQTTVQVLADGQTWLIVDAYAGSAWKLVQSTGSPGQTEAFACLSFFPLRQPRNGSATYLDLAVEAQGYVYVLYYLGDGTAATDYLLDIYGPDGHLVSTTPDPAVTSAPQNVVAGRLAVDVWRDVYALTFETLTGPGGDPQPGVAHWTPTPPLFSLPLSEQPAFNGDNISVVVNAFASNGITLSSQAFVTTQNADGAWQVKDGATIYDVYRSGDGLQVYGIPA